MKEVTVLRPDLLETIRTNRNRHRETYEEAVKIYRQRLMEWLEERIKQLQRNEKVRMRVNLPEPVDYTDQYDRAIRMLEMSTEEEIKISSTDFDRFVMDNWEWREHFAANTSFYVEEHPE